MNSHASVHLFCYTKSWCNMFPSIVSLSVALSFLTALAATQASDCSTTLTPTNSAKPTVASGYRMALVATGLTSPRSIQFDSAGNLLVAESGSGVSSLAFQDDGGTCLTVKTKKTVIDASTVCVWSGHCQTEG